MYNVYKWNKYSVQLWIVTKLHENKKFKECLLLHEDVSLCFGFINCCIQQHRQIPFFRDLVYAYSLRKNMSKWYFNNFNEVVNQKKRIK